MGKAIPYVFLGVSIAFFLVLTGLTAYRVDSARRTNAAQADASAAQLLQSAADAQRSTGGFTSPYFKQRMRNEFSNQPRLLAMTIYSDSDGILYVISRDRSYLRDPQEPAPDWRGVPLYNVSPGTERLTTLSFAAPNQTVTLDALFVVLGREDLYPILRDDLFLFFAFLVVCAVFILIYVSAMEPDGVPESASAAPRAAPEVIFSPQPTPPPPPAPPPPESGAAFGLSAGDTFDDRLQSEVARSASTDQDLSVALVEIDYPAPDSDQGAVLDSVTRLLKSSFPLHDLLFQLGSRTFAAVIPDMDVDQAVRIADGFRARVSQTDVAGRIYTVSTGVTARAGRLVDRDTLRREAEVALRKAITDGGNRVVGFRADPSRYRETLAPAGRSP